MIKKVIVRIDGINKEFETRYENAYIRKYFDNKVPKSVTKFIETTPFKTIAGIEYGKEVSYFIFEA